MLRSTDADTVAPLFRRVAETHALPATVSLTIIAMLWSRLINSPGFFDHALTSQLPGREKTLKTLSRMKYHVLTRLQL